MSHTRPFIYLGLGGSSETWEDLATSIQFQLGLVDLRDPESVRAGRCWKRGHSYHSVSAILVVRPGAPSSVLAASSKARSP